MVPLVIRQIIKNIIIPDIGIPILDTYLIYMCFASGGVVMGVITILWFPHTVYLFYNNINIVILLSAFAGLFLTYLGIN